MEAPLSAIPQDTKTSLAPIDSHKKNFSLESTFVFWSQLLNLGPLISVPVVIMEMIGPLIRSEESKDGTDYKHQLRAREQHLFVKSVNQRRLKTHTKNKIVTIVHFGATEIPHGGYSLDYLCVLPINYWYRLLIVKTALSELKIASVICSFSVTHIQ